jgi:hypothetical protein
MSNQFEAGGDMAGWPPNVQGKPTQAAVFGCVDRNGRKRCQILWTGQFPDLQPALYWAAKKEMAAVRKEKWAIASRVAWQHELTPEQAVEHCFKVMEPQLDRARGYLERGDDSEEFDVGEGPMKPIDPGSAKEVYVELVPTDDPTSDPLASFIAPGPLWEEDVEAIAAMLRRRNRKPNDN